jgi:hypothetical protein
MVDPIQPELHDDMNALARALDGLLNGPDFADTGAKKGFLLCVYHFGDPDPGKRFNYISNTDSLDVEKMLSDVLERQTRRHVDGMKLTLAERMDYAVRSLKAIQAMTKLSEARELAAHTLKGIGEVE